MSTYKLPDEPNSSQVWVKAPGQDGPLLATRAPWDRGWTLHLPHDRHSSLQWSALLAMGVVTDIDPEDVSWIPTGPWSSDRDYVNAANGDMVFEAYAPIGADGRARLTALVAQLVNAHVASKKTGGRS